MARGREWSLDLVSPEDELAREQAQPRFTWDMRDPPIQEQLQLDRANNDKIDPSFNISYDVLPFESGGGPLQLSYGNYLGAYARTWQKSRRNTLADSTLIIAVSLSKVSVHPCRKRTADGLSSPTTFLPRVKKPVAFSRGASFMPTSEKTLHTATVSDALQLALDLVQKYPGLTKSVASVHDISAFGQSTTFSTPSLHLNSILLISAEDFELDGPSIASYGLDSIIGAEMKNWSFKEVGLEFSFQNLLSPSLTFGGLAEVVSMHLGVIPATD
ncbi:hypothetical protein KXV89_002817 [Aspergillus fumigatus]|nr:hypothetical protein KXV89_002817 [Aspergillus fumigatus]